MKDRDALSPIARRFLEANRRIERLMPILTPLGVALGFLFPGTLVLLRPYIPYLFGFMTLSGALKLRAADLGRSVRSPLPVLLFFLFAHLVMPLAALALGRLLNPGNPDITAGFVLLFSIPTAVSGFIWITIFRGASALSLALILLDTLAAPFLVPATVAFLLGTGISLDMTGMAVSLLAMVVLPTALGVGLNELSKGEVPRAASPYLGVPAKACLFLVVAANSAAVAPQVDFSDIRVWTTALQALGLGFLGFLLGRIAGLLGRLDRERTTALVFAVGLRNISAAATLAIAFFPKEAALPSILGMVFQQTMAALAGKFLLGSSRADRRSTAP